MPNIASEDAMGHPHNVPTYACRFNDPKSWTTVDRPCEIAGMGFVEGTPCEETWRAVGKAIIMIMPSSTLQDFFDEDGEFAARFLENYRSIMGAATRGRLAIGRFKGAINSMMRFNR